jgi:hypothetical protein
MTEFTPRVRMIWLVGAMLTGLASQYCVNFGICAAPF